MTATLQREPVLGSRPLPAGPTLRKVRLRSIRTRLEALAIFGSALLVYVALGYLVIVRWHVVVGDAFARLAHAYFVWWNDPAKLVSIGFVWPPLQTIVFLPLTLIKPLATSLVALPMASAPFAAATLVVLARTLESFGVSRSMRLTLVFLLGVNPMFAFYASNGMAEIVYLFFLTWAVSCFARWYLTRESRHLLLSGFAFSLGVLTRYEMLEWAGMITVVMLVHLARNRWRPHESEASLLAFLAPIGYALGLWIFMNWTILGSPFYFLQVQGALRETNVVTDASTTAHFGLETVLRTVAVLNWNLFMPSIIVAAALLVVSVARRSTLGFAIALALLINPLSTAALVYRTHQVGLLELRYNMRGMPLAIIGMGWLMYLAPRRVARLIGIVCAVVLIAAIPLTWRAMQHYPHQIREQAFTRALASRHDQSGTLAMGPYGTPFPVGFRPAQEMASYVRRHVHASNSILTDDAVTFDVMLLSGRPNVFFDRIDFGDARWFEAARQLSAPIRYLLITDQSNDVLRGLYPTLGPASHPRVAIAFSTGSSTLFRLLPPVRKLSKRAH